MVLFKSQVFLAVVLCHWVSSCSRIVVPSSSESEQLKKLCSA